MKMRRFLTLSVLGICSFSCLDLEKACMQIDLKKGSFLIDRKGVFISSLVVLNQCNRDEQIFALVLKEGEPKGMELKNKGIFENRYDLIGAYSSISQINCDSVYLIIRARKDTHGRYYSFSSSLSLTNEEQTICSSMH